MIKVSSHQPSLLPWSGYWHKVAASDLHIMSAGLQFSYGNYQNRVMLNGSWLTVPIDKRDKHALIKDVRISEAWHPADLRNAILGRLGKPRTDAHAAVLEAAWRLDGARRKYLVDALCHLNIDTVGRYVGLTTIWKLLEEDPGGETKVDRLISRICVGAQVAPDDPLVYLCGQGTFSYLEPELDKWPKGWGLQLQVPLDPDPESVLKVLATEDDPLAAINRQWAWREVLPAG